MIKKIKLFSVILLAIFISSCAHDNESPIKNYANQKGDQLDIRDYFNGNLEGSGVVMDSSGKVVKKFTVKINGNWDDNKGVIKKRYFFTDGSRDSKTWLVSLDNDNINFSAVGHDVIGTAIGSQYGGTMHMRFDSMISLKGKNKEKVTTDEILHLVKNGSISTIKLSNQSKIIMSLHKVKEKRIVKKVSNPIVAQPVEKSVEKEVIQKSDVEVR